MHGHVVSLVAFDQILWLLPRSADGIGFKLNGRGDFLLYRSPDVARFRVPRHMISNFKGFLHRNNIFSRFSYLHIVIFYQTWSLVRRTQGRASHRPDAGKELGEGSSRRPDKKVASKQRSTIKKATKK